MAAIRFAFSLVYLSLATNGFSFDPSKEEETFAADQAYIKEHYTKYEYRIPMRDGVRLFTAVYIPKDASEAYPILLRAYPVWRPPLWREQFPNGPLGPDEILREGGIHFCVSGCARSKRFGRRIHPCATSSIREGIQGYRREHRHIRHDRLVDQECPLEQRQCRNPGCFLSWLLFRGRHDRCAPGSQVRSPQAPIADWFIGDDFRHNGALYLAHSFRFLSSFGQQLQKPTRQSAIPFDYETPDGYEFYLRLGPLDEVQKKFFEKDILFWNELLEHDTYDAFWKARSIAPYLKNIKPAVMTVGGWFDAEDLYGPLKIYRAVEEQSPHTFNILVMGPWSHGAWQRGEGDKLGSVSFDQKTALFYRNQLELPFLMHFLKGSPDPKLPEACVFETGTNQWHRYDSWPPSNTKVQTLYFESQGRLTFNPPQGGIEAFDEYVSDPHKPVPFIPNIAIGMTNEHMLDDQRFAASRPDVLVYSTEPLSEDLTLAGPIVPRLFVSTTGTDSDWVVKLIDVYSGDFPNPDPNPNGVQMGGYQQLVRGEAMRGKFRDSFEIPKPFEPGKVTRVEFTMPDVYHTFRRGHRIMIQIQSSWFPLVDRNPQQFMEIYHAKEKDFQKATQRLYRSTEENSQLSVRVLAKVHSDGIDPRTRD